MSEKTNLTPALARKNIRAKEREEERGRESALRAYTRFMKILGLRTEDIGIERDKETRGDFVLRSANWEFYYYYLGESPYWMTREEGIYNEGILSMRHPRYGCWRLKDYLYNAAEAIKKAGVPL